MEIFKSILALITSFFKSKTAQTTADVKLANAVETSTVETIAATSNATAVQAEQTASIAVQNLAKQQEVERKVVNAQPLSKRVDDQFGSDQ